MIALAAHEEEGPREVFEDTQTGVEAQGPDAPLPGDAACHLSSHSCAPETADDAPAREYRLSPGWALLEEFRLGLLSARVRMFDRERFPAC